jgi:hypothetical protein
MLPAITLKDISPSISPALPFRFLWLKYFVLGCQGYNQILIPHVSLVNHIFAVTAVCVNTQASSQNRKKKFFVPYHDHLYID